MKAIILNGGQRQSPCDRIADRAVAWARDRGAAPVRFDLNSMEIKPCRGCFACWVRTPGRCIQRDAMDDILPVLSRAETIVWITPVTFGGYGYHLKKALDRSIPVLLPFFRRMNGEVHHPMRYGVERRLAVIGTQSGTDENSEKIFHELARRNALNLQARSVSLVLADGGSGDWPERLDLLFENKEPGS